MPDAVEYSSQGAAPEVKVAGLEPSDYKVTYSNNDKVGTATVLIEAVGSGYKGSITRYYDIDPMRASLIKAKAVKKKIKVKAKTKVSLTGGSFYQIRYRIKGMAKWKKVNTRKQKAALKKVKKGKKYQVQIRACAKVDGKMYCGAWSKARVTKKVK